MLVHYDKENLEIINVSYKNRLPLNSSSKGNQVKWFKEGKFIKLNTHNWYEDISEVLASYIASNSSIDDFVQYYPCNIVEDGVERGIGVYSYNFLRYDEQSISFSRLLKSYGLSINTCDFDYVRDNISDIVGFDIKDYIGKCLCLDAMTLNEDRHLNNLSVIRTPKGYREAPVYDNGLAFLSDTFSYPLEGDTYSYINSILAKPFKGDFQRQIAENYISPIYFNRDCVNNIKVSTREEKRALSVLNYCLDRSEGVAWIEY